MTVGEREAEGGRHVSGCLGTLEALADAADDRVGNKASQHAGALKTPIQGGKGAGRDRQFHMIDEGTQLRRHLVVAGVVEE